MNKKNNLILALFMLVLIPLNVSASSITYDELPGGSYIIGTHIFTRESGALTLRKIMFASRTIPGSELDDMKIIYKTMVGTIVETSVVNASGDYEELEVSGSDVINFEYKDLATDMSAAVTTKGNALIAKYYNKFNVGGSSAKWILPGEADFDNDNFYVEVGEYKDAVPEEIKLNNNTYNNESKPFSIGCSAYLYAPVWKVENQKLYVATAWLLAESLPGTKTDIVIGSKTFSVNVFDSSVEKNKMKLESVYALSTLPNEVNEAEIAGENVINVKSSHGNHILGMVISNNGKNILNTDTSSINDVVFRLDSSGNMGFTKPETIEGKDLTYAVYLESYGKDFVDGNSEASTKVYKLGIPGQGTINITVNFTPVYPEG